MAFYKSQISYFIEVGFLRGFSQIRCGIFNWVFKSGICRKIWHKAFVGTYPTYLLCLYNIHWYIVLFHTETFAERVLRNEIYLKDQKCVRYAQQLIDFMPFCIKDSPVVLRKKTFNASHKSPKRPQFTSWKKPPFYKTYITLKEVEVNLGYF